MLKPCGPLKNAGSFMTTLAPFRADNLTADPSPSFTTALNVRCGPDGVGFNLLIELFRYSAVALAGGPLVAGLSKGPVFDQSLSDEDEVRRDRQHHQPWHGHAATRDGCAMPWLI